MPPPPAAATPVATGPRERPPSLAVGYLRRDTLRKQAFEHWRRSELEKARRGIYGGCVGYFGADGTMDTCIVLRTAIIKDNTLYVQAGAGIVADSRPELEQLECENKARALFSAAEEALRYAGEARIGQ